MSTSTIILIILGVIVIGFLIMKLDKGPSCKKSGQKCNKDSVCCGNLTCAAGTCAPQTAAAKSYKQEQDCKCPYNVSDLTNINYRSLPQNMPYWMLAEKEEDGQEVPMDKNEMQCTRQNGNLVLYDS